MKPFFPTGRPGAIKRLRSFTLVEVVITMAIFAFAIVIILNLMSSLMSSSRESWMETRAAQLARQIQDDLTPNPDTNAPASGTEATPDQGVVWQTTNSGVEVPLEASQPGTNTVYYTTDGIPMTTNGPTAVFQAQIILEMVTNDPAVGALPARNISQLEIDIRPAAATNSTPWQFLSRLTPQTSD